MTENYTLDLNNWLSQVLADGTNTYLYGPGRIAQYDAGGGEYFLGDTLGSVRQLSDATGNVILAKSYQPFGNVMQSVGTGSSPYGFTNEWTDGNGLVYLRTRYYELGIGRFITKDVWPGDFNHPLSLNSWLYVYANPINFSDPSGHDPFPPPPQPDARDLTDWLVREMYANANGREVRLIRNFNLASLILSRSPFLLPSTKDTAATILSGYAMFKWRELVKDGARWDFKDTISYKIGKTIMLCHTSGCEWFEYSVPGNIHYSYVGRAAGFSREILHVGASVAEIMDPSHRELLDTLGKYFINIHEFINFFCLDIYVNFSWWATGFDSPTDFAAIDLGDALYSSAKRNVRMEDIKVLLSAYSHRLEHMPAPPELYVAPKYWPYPLGFYDGGLQ